VDMPMEMQLKLLHYYESRKDPATGFYYDTDDCTNSSTRLLARAQGYSKTAVRLLRDEQKKANSNTLKKVNDSRIANILKMYPELSSPEEFTNWLSSQNWDNPWVGGDRTQARLSILKEFPHEKL